MDIKPGRDGKLVIHTPTADYPVPAHIKNREELRRYVQNAFDHQYISAAKPAEHGRHTQPGFKGYPAHIELVEARQLVRRDPFVQPERGFASEQEAVAAYGKYLHNLAMKADVEFGAELLRTPNARFVWGRTMAGDSSSVEVKTSIEKPPQNAQVVTHMHSHDLRPGIKEIYGEYQGFSTADLRSTLSLLPRSDGTTVIYNIDSRTGDSLRMTLSARGRQELKVAMEQQDSLGRLAKRLLDEGDLRIDKVADADPRSPDLKLGVLHDDWDTSGYIIPVDR